MKRALIAIAVLLLTACGSARTAALASLVRPGASGVSLAGWNLTLPVNAEGQPEGDAKELVPARLDPPYLTRGKDGSLVFYAPSVGARTPDSEHARTELVATSDFTVGKAGTHILTATLSVQQTPSDTHLIVIGQIHGAGSRSSVPWVLVQYDSATKTISCVVERSVKGTKPKLPVLDIRLLTDVPLGGTFRYSIAIGPASLSASASYDGRVDVVSDIRIPAAFSGMPVRFQAGDYQQDGTPEEGSAGRVTFFGLTRQ
jgi:hypothetical protein